MKHTRQERHQTSTTKDNVRKQIRVSDNRPTDTQTQRHKDTKKQPTNMAHHTDMRHPFCFLVFKLMGSFVEKINDTVRGRPMGRAPLPK